MAEETEVKEVIQKCPLFELIMKIYNRFMTKNILSSFKNLNWILQNCNCSYRKITATTFYSCVSVLFVPSHFQCTHFYPKQIMFWLLATRFFGGGCCCFFPRAYVQGQKEQADCVFAHLSNFLWKILKGLLICHSPLPFF